MQPKTASWQFGMVLFNETAIIHQLTTSHINISSSGTYNPVMKNIYADEHPLDASTLTAIRTLLAAVALGIAVAFDRLSSSKAQDPPEAVESPMEDTTGRLSKASVVYASVSELVDSTGDLPKPTSGWESVTPASMPIAAVPLLNSPGTQGLAILSMASSSVFIAGIELGLYNFGGTALQAIGLQLTSATRAGFIIQSTALLTPAIAYLAVRCQRYLLMPV